MRKDIAIYGAGGFARETLWLVNSFLCEQYSVKCFVVDHEYFEATPKVICGLNVYPEGFLVDCKSELGVVMAVGISAARKRIYEKLKLNGNIFFPTLVHPTTTLAPDVRIGEGTIIRGSGLLSVNVEVGKCVLINGSNNFGHDVVVGDFCSIMPRCAISGNVVIGEGTSIGAMSFIFEKKHIGKNVTIAPGSIVMRNLPDNVTVMGNPAKIYLHR